MKDLIKKKGQYFYANCSYLKVVLRDSLKTGKEELAIERLIELFLMVRDGKYQLHKTKFDDLAKNYQPKGKNKKNILNKLAIVKNHLTPKFKGKRLTEIDIQTWAEDIVATKTKQTALAILLPAKEMGFEINTKGFIYNNGRRFNGTQILSEEMALDCVSYLKTANVRKKYIGIVSVAMWSTLPLSDLLHLNKAQVVFKGPQAGITYTRRKTRYKGKDPLFVPMNNRLREAFRGIPTPIFEDDLWFPNMDGDAVSQTVSRALIKVGWKHGGAMHNFRHFGACNFIKLKVPLTSIQKLLGHSDFNTTLIYARTSNETLIEDLKIVDAK